MSSADERARARATWPTALTTLEAQEEALGPEDATAAWNAVLELTLEAWSLAGPLPPPLPRAERPSWFYRLDGPRPE